MAGNTSLVAARVAKNDEFYTQWNDIENEMQAYLEYNPDVFRGKTVLLPCDDPEWSNFTKYFALNFEPMGIKKLISTSCAPAKSQENGRIFVLERDVAYDGKINIHNIEWDYLNGDGDFRSDEVTKLRDEADIVVTNPPFSLFREFLAWLVEGDVKFSIIGNKNAITYKEVFPMIRDNKLWLGNGFAKGNAYFRISPELARDFAAGMYDEDTSTVHFRNIDWFTNIEHGRRHEPLVLMTMEDNLVYGSKKVRSAGYPKYDNYDATEVPETKGIPSDYAGVMGVPISFLDKYNPDQFEIIGYDGDECLVTKQYGKKEKVVDGQRMKSVTGTLGCTIRYEEFGEGTFFDVGYPVKNCYKRIFIRHRNPERKESLSRSRSGQSSPRCKREFSHVEVRG